MHFEHVEKHVSNHVGYAIVDFAQTLEKVLITFAVGSDQPGREGKGQYEINKRMTLRRSVLLGVEAEVEQTISRSEALQTNRTVITGRFGTNDKSSNIKID